MITNEKILEIASQHLRCNMSVEEWSGKSEDILNFALALYEEGYDDGYSRGYGDGEDIGYDRGTLDGE